jgi:hypothetical protein
LFLLIIDNTGLKLKTTIILLLLQSSYQPYSFLISSLILKHFYFTLFRFYFAYHHQWISGGLFLSSTIPHSFSFPIIHPSLFLISHHSSLIPSHLPLFIPHSFSFPIIHSSHSFSFTIIHPSYFLISHYSSLTFFFIYHYSSLILSHFPLFIPHSFTNPIIHPTFFLISHSSSISFHHYPSFCLISYHSTSILFIPPLSLILPHFS